VGAVSLTKKLAIGLKTSLAIAEDLKIRYGTADPRAVRPEELVTVTTVDESGGRTVQRAELTSIIEARMRELFEKIGEQIAAGDHGGMLPERRTSDARAHVALRPLADGGQHVPDERRLALLRHPRLEMLSGHHAGEALLFGRDAVVE